MDMRDLIESGLPVVDARKKGGVSQDAQDRVDALADAVRYFVKDYGRSKNTKAFLYALISTASSVAEATGLDKLARELKSASGKVRGSK